MRDFSKIYKEDLDNVGKKAVELAELFRLGIPIPDGFVITTTFFKRFLQHLAIDEKIDEIHELKHPSLQDSVENLFNLIRKQILHTPIPGNLTAELHTFYRKLSGVFKDPSLNIFSSSPSNNKSVMFKNVKGDANLILKIKEIWASNIDNPVAIVVQKNINSKKRGRITTDDPRLSASLAGELGSASVPIKELEEIAQKIQKHFYFPQEVDYVIEKNKIYITRIKPFTGRVEKLQKYAVQNRKTQKLLMKGVSINPGIVTGPVKVFRNSHDVFKMKTGEIIVLPHFDLSLFEKLKKAKAIIIDDDLSRYYNRTLYRRNFKMPMIEGTMNATKLLQDGNVVTVNGESGEIYSGGLI